MRRCFVVLAACVTTAFSQVGFECSPLGLLPADPASNCEGVCSNNRSTLTAVVGAPASCLFPTAGIQYLRIGANGGSGTTAVNVNPAGPVTRPLAEVISEVRIPIPAGASAVAFDWEFFNAESASGSYNDGISVDVVSPGGALVGNLVYADAWAGEGTCLAVAGSQETVPSLAFQSFAGVLPPYSPCDYISIAVWNEGDNAVASRAYIDNLVFDFGVIGCAPPCFGPLPPPAGLSWSSPSGPGCVFGSIVGLPPGGTYLLLATFNPPPGWLFGINISVQELALEINAGYPFSGPLSPDVSCVGGGGAASIGQFCGLPSGLTFYSVALGLNGVGLGGPVTIGENTAAVAYTIP
jgi:hypothetical protein